MILRDWYIDGLKYALQGTVGVKLTFYYLQ